MKHIALLTTGGTIASQKDENTGLQIAGSLSGEAIFQASQIDVSSLDFSVSVHSIFQLPSNGMGYQQRDELINAMKTLRNEGRSGFVITHGTDTMEETAYYLALHWPYPEPVILTGSQLDPGAHNTDAFHNLLSALRVAACDHSRMRGVQLVFNDSIFDARYVTKWHASNINGFGAPQCGPSGIVDGEHVYYFVEPKQRATFQHPSINHGKNRIEIVPSYLDMDPEIINFWQAKGVKGLIVEGFGRGQVPVQLGQALKKVLHDGLTIVITTACTKGFVAPIYGYEGSFGDLLACGAISGGDFASKKARILLHSLFMANVTVHEDVTYAFSFASPY